MIQRGRNKNYPEKVEIWRVGDKKVPEWLSDRARVVLVDLGTGYPIISMNKIISGGYEIIDATGSGVLVKTKNDSDVICFGDSKIFSLTERQLDLLYMEENKRGII